MITASSSSETPVDAPTPTATPATGPPLKMPNATLNAPEGWRSSKNIVSFQADADCRHRLEPIDHCIGGTLVLRQALPDVHARLVADLPRRRLDCVEPGLVGLLRRLREVGGIVVKHVDVGRRARRDDTVQVVPHPIAHEACGDAPVGQGERADTTKLFHAHRVLGDDGGDEGHALSLVIVSGDMPSFRYELRVEQAHAAQVQAGVEPGQAGAAICIAGVDEAGRGPLAGPVFAAAVILDPAKRIEGLKDSKLLPALARERLAGEVKQHAIAWAVAWSDVAEIDTLNILNATLLAMRRAFQALGVTPIEALVDGDRMPDLGTCPTSVRGSASGTRCDRSPAAMSAAVRSTARSGRKLARTTRYPTPASTTTATAPITSDRTSTWATVFSTDPRLSAISTVPDEPSDRV